MNYTVQRKNNKSKCKEPISRLKVWKQFTLELYLTFLSLTQLKEQVTVTQFLDTPWGFQEVAVLRFQKNWNMKVLRLSALSTGRLYPENISGNHFCQRLNQPQEHSVAERIMSMKIPMIPLGIESATFQLVAQFMKQIRLRLPAKIILTEWSTNAANFSGEINIGFWSKSQHLLLLTSEF